MQRVQYCSGDWGQAGGRADTRAGACRGMDLHNNGIIEGQQDASAVEPQGGPADSHLEPRQ